MISASLLHDQIAKAVDTSNLQFTDSHNDPTCHVEMADSLGLAAIDSLQGREAVVSATLSTLCHTLVDQKVQAIEELFTKTVISLIGEWLNENLPSLVERLVGEEIERISGESRSMVLIDDLQAGPMGSVCALIRMDEELEDHAKSDIACEELPPAMVRAVEIASDEGQPRFWLRRPARSSAEQFCLAKEAAELLRPRAFRFKSGQLAATITVSAFLLRL